MFGYYVVVILLSFIIGWQLCSVFGRQKAIRVHIIGVLLFINMGITLYLIGLLTFYEHKFTDYFVAFFIPIVVAFVATMINDQSMSQ
ncbi:MAG: hypothetical protein ACOCU2_03010 [Bacillota bacterium]